MAHNLGSICSFSLHLSSLFPVFFLCPNINICLPLAENSGEECTTIYQHPEFSSWRSRMILEGFPSTLGVLRQLSILLQTPGLWLGFLCRWFLFWFPFTVLNLQNILPQLAPLFPQPPRVLEYYTVSTPISQSFPAGDWHKSSDRISNRLHHYQTTSVLAQTS